VMVKLACEENAKTRWLAVLMDNSRDANVRKTPKPL